MLERVPTVLTGQEILDKAFHRAGKIDIPDPVRYHRIRKTEATRMQSVVDTVCETLARFPAAFPNMDGLREYDREVLDIVTGLPRLKKALGSVSWASQKIRDVGRQAAEQMRRERTVDGIKAAQRKCYGRLSSIVYDVDPDLTVLRETRDACKQLPSVRPDYATVVIAGYPNVGKTSLLRAWTGSKAEINEYAFTTKHAEVGHFDARDRHGVETRYQVVDTPGLLDRPDEERNPIERQAVAALRHAADALLFLIDPTETSGYSLQQQEALLEQTRGEMAGVPFLVAESKWDFAMHLDRTQDSDRPVFSTLTGEGVEELRARVMEMLPDEGDLDLEVDPLDQWRGAKS